MGDLNHLRIIWGIENLRYAAAAAGGAPAVAEINVLDRRSAIAAPALTPEQVVTKTTFGPCSNNAFVDLFTAENAIYSKFCIFNANIGVFSGNFAHANVPKMVQFLSYLRLKMIDLLPANNQVAQATYQSYAMAEMFGPYVPNNRRMNQENSRAAIIAAVNYALDPANDINRPDDGEWFDPILGLGANVAAVRAIANMTIQQAMVILEAMAIALPTGPVWLSGISMITTTIASLAKKGVISNAAMNKICNGVKQDTGAPDVRCPIRTCSAFFTKFGRWVTPANARGLFEHYNAIIPEACIRLTATVNQAARTGLTTYFTIRRAITEYPDFPWDQAVARFFQDFVHFERAERAVAGNVYYGYTHDVGPAAAANFKSLAYLSFQLCIRAGHDQNIADYGGMPREVPAMAWIDNAINEYIHNAQRLGEELPVLEAQAGVRNNILDLMRLHDAQA